MADNIKALEAQIAALTAQNEALARDKAAAEAKAAARQTITYKVGEKGGLCAYGLQVRPIHFYLSQIERFDTPEERAKRWAFIDANRDAFATKG